MATLVPSLNSCLGKMMPGEKRLARRLEALLEDDYLCWYELPVGKRQRYTDFIVLHPGRGLLLLEVKDWKVDTIQSIDPVSVTLLTNRGVVTSSNPLEQARQCTYQLINLLEKDSQLVRHGGRYQGRLSFPYGYGVVLPNISRTQFDTNGLGEVLPAHQVICRDEMTESAEAEEFQKRLWDMFNVGFNCQLTLPQIDRVRWHLFPEVRIGDGQVAMFEEGEEDSLVPDLMKVMDIQQEQLARSLGEGHRIIHGVAGSGKTLILGYRCLYLAKVLHQPILVLCFNITLAARLRLMMEGKEINDRVHVYHFHDWCGEMLKRYHIEKPKSGAGYVDRLVNQVIKAVEEGHIPKGQYGALMVDEGHDFEAEWLQLIVQMVDPETSSLLLLYDDAQSIYKKKALDFSLSSVGVQARGRTTILKLNYRNTTEVLDYAYRFAKHYLSPAASDEDHIPLVEPQSAGRHGFKPYLKQLPSFDEEASYVARNLKRIHDGGMQWYDMCIVYRNHWMGEVLLLALQREGVPTQLLASAEEKKAFRPAEDSVKLMTMHSSKGLEFPLVSISGLGYMPGKHDDLASEAKLLYVAMTRSTDKLLLTCHKESDFVRMLAEA
ncbi:MAG: DNA helicase II [Bacteroidetes bacterium]|nr:MAG: DNA helicase II [Bacteroidota bacterium]